MNDKKVIAIDFDGVLNNYSGWAGEDELGTPRECTELFLKMLSERFKVVVFTVRDSQRVRNWLKEYNLLYMVDHITNRKPKAIAYIDDRAINFNGNYVEVLEKLDDFHTWWEQ